MSLSIHKFIWDITISIILKGGPCHLRKGRDWGISWPILLDLPPISALALLQPRCPLPHPLSTSYNGVPELQVLSCFNTLTPGLSALFWPLKGRGQADAETGIAQDTMQGGSCAHRGISDQEHSACSAGPMRCQNPTRARRSLKNWWVPGGLGLGFWPCPCLLVWFLCVLDSRVLSN